jgi:hypothetical protein
MTTPAAQQKGTMHMLMSAYSLLKAARVRAKGADLVTILGCLECLEQHPKIRRRRIRKRVVADPKADHRR